MLETLSGGQFLRFEDVLNQTVEDCFGYMEYLSQKTIAEEEEYKFQKKLNKQTKH